MGRVELPRGARCRNCAAWICDVAASRAQGSALGACAATSDPRHVPDLRAAGRPELVGLVGLLHRCPCWAPKLLASCPICKGAGQAGSCICCGRLPAGEG